VRIEQAAFEEAYWTVNSLKVFSATGGLSRSGTSAAGHKDVSAAVSGNGRDTTEAAANASIGNRLLLQQDSQALRDEQLLQIHVHRESRECFLLIFGFLLLASTCCLPARTRCGAVQVDK
jgi:hypothetical protein